MSSKIEVPNKDCEREDCRYYTGRELSTLMYFQPIYDKNGNNINPDRNTTSGEMFCSVCKRKWRYVKRLGEYSYEEVTQDLTSSVESGIIDSVEIDTGC